jgi:hypothetical protein
MNRPTLTLCLAASAAALALPAQAQGFAAFISPPRFEVQAQAGQTLRQVIEIQHVGRTKGNYRIATNDWTLGADNAVNFSAELAPDSCRPWVAIERRDITIDTGARYRYRFEITPPPGTPPRECRFAIMVEGLEPARVQGNINFPVGGRIGVIVYASVGGAAPALAITGTEVQMVNGKPVALLSVRNSGTATGRLEGFVNATDASGQRVEMAPADLPVLPGETRRIALNMESTDTKTPPELRFPLRIKGELESGKARLPLDASFAAP